MSTSNQGNAGPLLTFQVITDTHVTADPEHEYNLHFERALQDLAIHAQGSSGIMHIGDITDHGFPEEYDEVRRILNLHQASLPELRFTLGNHDVGLGDWESRLGLYASRTGMPGPYHDHWIGGYHFIFMGTEAGLPTFCDLSSAQLRWLEQKLGERAAGQEARVSVGERAAGQHMGMSDKTEVHPVNEQTPSVQSGTDQPIFLFLHQPLKNTVAGSLESQEWYGVTQDLELRSILSRYPQTLLFTGHTHWELEVETTMFPGYGKTATMFNSASVAYLWTDADEHKTGSQGYYVEVYIDKVLVRGRDFMSGSWIESAKYEIPFPLVNVRA